MQEEREELIKQVFPGLRRYGRQRGVDLVEVDLRWGITEAQANRGEVLALCIQEIDKCRPYFIGILGERYGTVPEGLVDEPWALPGASITHMEVNWAAFRPGVNTDRTFFFFKRQAAGPEPQRALKSEIRAAGLSVEEYDDPDDLGQRVERALKKAIDSDFPEAKTPTWLDLEREAMVSFQTSRSQVYVPRPEWLARLDGPGSVVVTGPSGSGKSSLLANWAAGSTTRVFDHFFGASPEGTSADRVIHRLLAEVGDEVPPDPADHRAAVFPSLAAAAPLTLVLDAVEHVDDISWLPDPLPEGVRIIASGRPGPALDSLLRRGYPSLHLTGLTPEDRQEIVTRALARHGKTLSEPRLSRIAHADQTANPLFLRTLTDELRLLGDHEALDHAIDRMLEAPDAMTLFDRVLERLESDYEQEYLGLVGATLSAIAAARRGLSEPEIIGFLAVAPIHWAPLSSALEGALMNRAGVLTFFHEELRAAVRARYTPTDKLLKEQREALIRYFLEQTIDDRVAEELPWLQHEVGDTEGLVRSLTNLDLFLNLQLEGELQDLVRWWRSVDGDPAEGYLSALADFAATSPPPLQHAAARHRVARFLQMVSRLNAALPLFDEARRLYEQALEPGDPTLGVIANDHGLALFIAGRYAQAEPLFRRALEITGDVGGILHNLAEILLRRSEPVEAEGVARRAVEAHRAQLGRHELTATSMQNLARARMEQGDLEGADIILTEALDMVEGPPSRALALALSNLGNLRLRQGRLQDSETTLKRSIDISREVLGEAHPHAAATLSALAGTLFFAGREPEAEGAYRESIELVERYLGPNHPNLNNSLVALANLHLRRGEAEEADTLAGRALAIAEREFGPDSVDAANALQSLAAAAASQGDYDRASNLAFRASKLHEDALGVNHAATNRSWDMVAHLGRSLLDAEDPVRAEPLLRATLARTERRLGPTHPQIGPDLWNLARTLIDLGRHSEAVPLLERELQLLVASKGPQDEETVASRNNLAAVRRAAERKK